MIRVCVSGLGRTGKEIAKVVMEQSNMKLVSAICSPGSHKHGKDLGELLGGQDTGIMVESSDHIEQIVFRTRPDVVIDFSTPDAALRNAKLLSKMKVNIVIGTTGFSKMSLSKLLVLTKKYGNGITYAPNITVGVNVLMLLTNLAASILNNYDFQISEIHHKHKKDAPSGTAFKIAKEVEKGLYASGVNIIADDVPINAIRAGGVIGKHEVMIIGEEDKIEISHESFSRKAFALGAIKAVNFAYKKSGYFEMTDVLNLKEILNNYLENDSAALKKKYLYYNVNMNDLKKSNTM